MGLFGQHRDELAWFARSTRTRLMATGTLEAVRASGNAQEHLGMFNTDQMWCSHGACLPSCIDCTG